MSLWNFLTFFNEPFTSNSHLLNLRFNFLRVFNDKKFRFKNHHTFLSNFKQRFPHLSLQECHLDNILVTRPWCINFVNKRNQHLLSIPSIDQPINCHKSGIIPTMKLSLSLFYQSFDFPFGNECALNIESGVFPNWWFVQLQ